MKNNKDVDGLSHTTWRCQYHVVFAPKYRRMVIYGHIKKDIGQILRKLCEQKDIEIIEAEACLDHIHMLISFSPKYSISYVMGYLKGKSSFRHRRKCKVVSVYVINGRTSICLRFRISLQTIRELPFRILS